MLLSLARIIEQIGPQYHFLRSAIKAVLWKVTSISNTEGFGLIVAFNQAFSEY